ncbi:MAG: Flp pilus assembly protein TadD [Planctomycetota bacterium]
MSQSPLDAEAVAEDAYGGGWAAIASLIREGRSWSGGEQDRAFLNLGGGRFADVSEAMGLDLVRDGRALARVDWDGDGDLDLVSTGRDGPRFRYLRNDLVKPGSDESAASISLRLVGTNGNTDAIGARVRWRPAGREGAALQMTRRAGEGYLAQSSARCVLGMGSAAQAGVEIRWPGGEWEDFGQLEAGRSYSLVQGSGRARRVPSTGSVKAPEQPAQDAAAGQPSVDGEVLILAAAVPLPSLEMLTAQGQRAELFGVGPTGSRGTGRPLVMQLWASWCAPCLKELGGMAQQAEEFERLAVDVLALSVDAEEDRPKALELLEQLGWKSSRGFAPTETIEVLDAILASLKDRSERLPLPTTLLFTPAGRLVAIYSGAVSPEQVLQNLDLVTISPEERRQRAVPFAGRFLGDAPAVDLARLQGALNRRGLRQAAEQYGLAQIQVKSVDQAGVAYEVGVARARQGRTQEALELFRQAADLDPSQAATWSALGWAAETTGELEEALAAYRRALALDGSDATARFNLGRLALAQGGLEEARAQQLILARIHPELGARLAQELAAYARRGTGSVTDDD